MPEIESYVLFSYFLFLFFPFIFGYLAKKARIDPLIGYILAGLVLGIIFPEIIKQPTVINFAYFGIILLLFTAGLEIRLSQIFSLKKYILIGGILQIFFSFLTIFFLSLIFKLSFLSSFLIALAFSSSSTALAAKIIQERGEESSLLGQITLGILMVQDLAFIPFLILFTNFGEKTYFFDFLLKVSFSILKTSFLLLIFYFLGKDYILPFFNRLARFSRELLNLFIIVFIFFVTYISSVFHLPVLVGVFTAGILIGQTMEYPHIFSQIRPFRDLLTVIFFVFIGSNINFSFIFSNFFKIISFSFLVILLKTLVVLAIFLIFRFHSRTSFSLAMFLFSIDEDAFILLFNGLTHQAISQETFLLGISSVFITLVLTPIFVYKKDEVYEFLRRKVKKYLPLLDQFISSQIDKEISPIDALNLKNHVVICGYGRIGSEIGRVLLEANIPFVAIDYHFPTVEKARKHGVNIIYGDPTDIEILDYAEVENATILVSAVPDFFSQEAIILNAKKLNPKIIVISRIHRKDHLLRLKEFGADVVIQPETEASIAMVRKILLSLRFPKEKILDYLLKMRRQQISF